MKLLMFSASLRKDSYNTKLINLAIKQLESQNHTIDHANYADFCAENYNQDVQDSTGFPSQINNFVKRLTETDALIISSPEYNYSTPGTLKNIIDWVSRLSPLPFKNKQILLMSASPSLVGGNRGLWATRIPLEACGSFVFPDMFSLSNAHTAFEENGVLKDKKLQERLNANLTDFVNYISQVKK